MRVGDGSNGPSERPQGDPAHVVRVFDRGAVFRRRAALGYGLAVVISAVALATRYELDPVLPAGFPYLTFFPAVILTAFIAGTGPGVLCAVLSGLAAWYWFIPPSGDWTLNGPAALALGFYVFIVSVDIALIHLAQRSVERLVRARAVTAGLYDQQRTMFQELQHRVANNMAFVAGLLHLQRKAVLSSPGEAAAAFDEAARRIEIMGRIHRRLYDPAAVDAPIDEHLRLICTDLLDATGVQHVRCEVVDAGAVRLPLDRLVTLSLLATEMVTNALKHAFAPGAQGIIRVTLEAVGADQLALTVRDNGRGLAPGHEAGQGLGRRIMQGLVGQLDGALTVDGDGGVTSRVVFPA